MSEKPDGHSYVHKTFLRLYGSPNKNITLSELLGNETLQLSFRGPKEIMRAQIGSRQD